MYSVEYSSVVTGANSFMCLQMSLVYSLIHSIFLFLIYDHIWTFSTFDRASVRFINTEILFNHCVYTNKFHLRNAPNRWVSVCIDTRSVSNFIYHFFFAIFLRVFGINSLHKSKCFNTHYIHNFIIAFTHTATHEEERQWNTHKNIEFQFRLRLTSVLVLCASMLMFFDSN